ncbi:MAG: beta-ketoacyl synthase chain length factor [Thermomonas sp.]|uniref:beta-ketoacyl synthase chain length factor n=1 Tax=Thermomonas sp. TaxID=1971895 RepID=UPI001EBC7536|nr:beta-ketoacyl synthase chain length factor [Thermomonas sp.]MBV2209029.1 beta-ketoacyl synthase chain length factor [Thermomonas sp.]
MINFSVVDWAAWAPGLETREAWLAWAQAAGEQAPQGAQAPSLLEVPAMQRRRIDRLGRMAIQAAWWCARADADGVPLVFASRHGDVVRSLSLLDQLATGEPMSPTQFGLSVHNATAALYSILRGERGNYLALAAGRATAEAALIEAAGLLADGAPEVQLVVFDAPLPEAYADYIDEAEASYAWSWRVQAAAKEGALALHWQADASMAKASSLPSGLAPMRFLLSGMALHENCVDGLRWRWSRRAI